MAMTSFLDNVQGCVLYIQDLHSKIAFTTPSDALLTALFIKYARTVPLELFDDLFSIFQHADFRADWVTMRKSEDMMDHIAEQRRVNQVYSQEITKSPDVHQAHNSQPPGLVVELVVEYLESNRVPFDRTFTVPMTPRSFCESIATLRLMSLVRRSWRGAAQRHLRRRIYITSQKALREVFQNPQIGPWVHELSFRAYELAPGDNYLRGSSIAMADIPRLLSGILKRCPNITQLYLDNFFTRADREADLHDKKGGKELTSELNSGRPDLIRQLAEMKCLEHLWLHPTADLAPGLWKLCAVLPRLQNLKSLSLEGWDSRLPLEIADQSVEPSGFHIENCPPPSLTHLSLGGINIIDSEPITWIMSPRSGYSCTCLQLSLKDLFRSHRFGPSLWFSSSPATNPKDLRSLLRHMKLSVTKLQLVNHAPGDDVRSVMELFPSLRSLSLVGKQDFPDQLTLPSSSIDAFHFHYSSKTRFGQEDDSSCLALIKASPSIRKIRISHTVNVSWGLPDANSDSSTIFTDTMEYCTRNNVEFSITKEECIPNFLELE